jgi:hypothetical protein
MLPLLVFTPDGRSPGRAAYLLKQFVLQLTVATYDVARARISKPVGFAGRGQCGLGARRSAPNPKPLKYLSDPISKLSSYKGRRVGWRVRCWFLAQSRKLFFFALNARRAKREELFSIYKLSPTVFRAPIQYRFYFTCIN